MGNLILHIGKVVTHILISEYAKLFPKKGFIRDIYSISSCQY